MCSRIEPSIHRWTPHGTVYVWRYLENVRNYPGWNIALDKSSQDGLKQLCLAFAGQTDYCYRTIPITRPTKQILQVPNNKSGHAQFSSPAKLRLEYDPSSPMRWSFELDDDRAVFIVGSGRVAEIKAVLDNPEQYFDQSIGGEPGLWLWVVLDAT